MFYVGCHLSSSKGYLHMAEEAFSIGASTFQYFSRNPRGGDLKKWDESNAKAFLTFIKDHDFGPIVTHAPYILNPAAKDDDIRENTLKTMKEDVERLEYFPNSLYNFHPGAHVGQGIETGLNKIVDFLNKLLVKGQKTTVLLETMAGKGTELGKTFEELSYILEHVKCPDVLGICLDTCHIYDGGYDIKENLNSVLKDFDHTIGLDKLKAIHINDSKNPFSSHKDRHERIGEGNLGKDAFRNLVKSKKLEGIPFILETPNDIAGYKEEIALLKSFRKA